MNIGEAIKYVRKQKGLTQKKLAEKSGVRQNTICQIELGNTFPQKGTLQEVAMALNVPVAYLLFKAITKEDVPEDKRETFDYLKMPLEKFLLE